MPSTYTVGTLKNGVRAVAIPMEKRKSAAVGVWVSIGARHESPALGGVSHFLEHLVFKGTKKRTANNIKEAVEGVGGFLNAFTSEEATCFLAKASSKHFDVLLDVLSDMVLDASLHASDIEKERTVVLEEIKMTQDQPSQLADENLSEILWPQHSLGRPIAGTAESVKALTHANIKKYRDQFYSPPFITVAAAGDISQKDVLSGVKQRFARLSGPKSLRTTESFKPKGTKPVFRYFNKSTEQTHMALGFHAHHKGHPKSYMVDILSVILGGNMSSRLFDNVREKRGLCYEIGSYTRKYQETGAFVVDVGVDHAKAPEALSVILRELKKIAGKEPSKDELRRAKEYYLGQLELGLESSMEHMLWAGESLVSLGRCRTPKEIVAQVGKITMEDISLSAAEIFKDASLHLSVVGPLKGSVVRSLERNLTF